MKKKAFLGKFRYNKIAILGCGWLGQLVGKELVDNEFQVFGSYRNDVSKTKLEGLKITPIHLDLGDISQLSIKLLDNIELVLIMFPPNSNSSYENLLVNLALKFNKNTRFIFTSSIGVYPKSPGIFDEESEVLSENTSRLVITENNLRKHLRNRLTILRLGGLIGPGRHPIYHIQGRVFKDQGTAPINLIHSGDVTAVILEIIKYDVFGGLYNIVFPDHSPKKEYYSLAAEKLQLTPPQFGDIASIHRTVQGNRFEAETSFNYTFPVSYFTDFE